MPETNDHHDHLDQPVTRYARADAALLPDSSTAAEALEAIRSKSIGERIVYFYVVDAEERLVGVLPTRRLLTASLDARLSDIMIPRPLAIPDTATVLEACEMFAMHKYFAFPVIDASRKVIGVVNADLLTEEVFDVADREQVDALFESIGFRISQVRDASPFRAFRFRFPWLLATITGGSICAFLAGAFEATLSESIVLAFFLTLVLGLGESVSIQSMTVAIHTLRNNRPTLAGYLRDFRREATTSVLLGAACGIVVGAIVFVWRGEPLAAGVIGGSIILALLSASFFGLTVPTTLHSLKLDPKIAAGPITLGLTDVFTLLFYFSLASIVL